MKNSKRLAAGIIEVIVGAVLIVCRAAGIIDEFWSGMGVALVVVGAIGIFRQIKYKTNDEYRRNVDVETNDERNKYISMKAWSWTGYIFVLISAVATIVLKICGYEELVPIASGSVCLMVLLYWVSYMCLRKKY